MEFANEIFGIKFNRVNGMLADKFNERYNEDEYIQFVSEEEFVHEEEDFNFKYRYIISGDALWENGKVRRFYMLSLVVTPDSLKTEKLESVLSCCGVTKEDCTCEDVYDYGCSIPFGNEMVECDESEDTGWDMDKFEDIANVFIPMDRMRGFHLDKPLNRLGNTGWDFLSDFIHGKSLIDSAIERYGE